MNSYINCLHALVITEVGSLTNRFVTYLYPMCEQEPGRYPLRVNTAKLFNGIQSVNRQYRHQFFIQYLLCFCVNTHYVHSIYRKLVKYCLVQNIRVYDIMQLSTICACPINAWNFSNAKQLLLACYSISWSINKIQCLQHKTIDAMMIYR